MAGTLHILDTVESTNNHAIQQIRNGNASHGDAWMAMVQTQGKGQRNRHWESLPGENILMSVVVRPGYMDRMSPFLFQALVAIACRDFLAKHIEIDVYVKWPNDIIINDRKAGGVLIENIYRGNSWDWAVVGLGINVNQVEFGGLSEKATSLKLALGKQYDVNELADGLRSFIISFLHKNESCSLEERLNLYQNVMYRLGSKVLFDQDGKKFHAIVLGVNQEGELRVEIDQKEQRWRHGMVNWLLNDAQNI
jgi:BirA family biotin operon repressor/biotin-[acetyl-CoA-carboxylase] ligase